MLRAVFNTALRSAQLISRSVNPIVPTVVSAFQTRSFSHFQPSVSLSQTHQLCIPANSSLLINPALLPIVQSLTPIQTRNVTKFSLKKGKRKTVKAAIKRFKRLDWGGWIRTHSGRNKKIWKKSPALKRRLKQHIFVNATQSWLLDKMVTKFWRLPKHYVDDPYNRYQTREEYYKTRRNPIK